MKCWELILLDNTVQNLIHNANDFVDMLFDFFDMLHCLRKSKQSINDFLEFVESEKFEALGRSRCTKIWYIYKDKKYIKLKKVY